MLDTGIYQIVNKLNGKRYIGSTLDSFENRWRQHRSLLRANRHHSKYLQNAWNKYGEDRFDFEVIERSKEEVVLTEQKYLDTEKPEYNVSKRADRPSGMLGKKHTKETIEKIRNSNLGLKRSEEAKAKMSKSKTGKRNMWFGTEGPMGGRSHKESTRRKKSKLTEVDVLNIRNKYELGKTSYRKLAKEYGVCHYTIQRVVKRETWEFLK